MLRSLWQDLRYSVRVLMKQPGMTLTAIAVLTLGIGVNAGIFGLINTLMIRPLPGQVIDQPVVGLFSYDRTSTRGYRSFSYPEFTELRDIGGPFSHLAAHNMAMVGVDEGHGTIRQGFVDVVSANYFDTMGVQLARGRTFTKEEERPGAASRPIIVNYTYWRRAGFPEDILGRTIRMNKQDYAIVGVAPEGFGGTMVLIGSEFWVPLGRHDDLETDFESRGPQRLDDRQNHTLLAIGRLKPGITQQQADEQLKAIAAAREQAFPVENKNQDLLVRPLSRMGMSTSPQSDTELWIPFSMMQALAGAVLLIACLNLANIMLATGAARQKEIAIRLAVGGSRGAIVRQLLVQGMLLSLAGGAFGLIVSSWAMNALVASISSVLPLSVVFDNSPDAVAIGATTLFCTIATVGFGLMPALRLSRTDVAPTLKDQAGEIGGRIGRFSVRGTLITIQLALSLALLILSGVFVRGAAAGASADPGFDLKPVVVAEIQPRLAGYDEARGHELQRRVLEGLRSTPGIVSAASSTILPFGEIQITSHVQREGRRLKWDEPDAKGKLVTADQYAISADYFTTLGLKMLRGRDFTPAEELGATGTQPVIIDAPLAAKLFPNEDPIGQILQLGANEAEDAKPMEIVGVAPGLRHGIEEAEPPPHFYIPSGRAASSWLFVEVRAANGNAESIVDTVRSTLKTIDADAPVMSVKSFSSRIDSSVGVWFLRAAARLFLTLGLAAALVAVIGLYGVKSYVMSRRTREIGVRMAVGATPAEIIRMAMREAARTTVAGVAAGLVLGTAAGFGMSKFMYLFQAFDPVSLLGSTAILATAALVATFVPARRASKVSPMTALRDS